MAAGCARQATPRPRRSGSRRARPSLPGRVRAAARPAPPAARSSKLAAYPKMISSRTGRKIILASLRRSRRSCRNRNRPPDLNRSGGRLVLRLSPAVASPSAMCCPHRAGSTALPAPDWQHRAWQRACVRTDGNWEQMQRAVHRPRRDAFRGGHRAQQIVAIQSAVLRAGSAGAGTTVSKNSALNGPPGHAIAPNGDVLTVNSGDGNIVETTRPVSRARRKHSTPPVARRARERCSGSPSRRTRGVYFADAITELDLRH